MSDNTKQLTEPFRGGLRRAVASYRAFEQTNAPLEPKEFAAHHNACKAALMHIALLPLLHPLFWDSRKVQLFEA